MRPIYRLAEISAWLAAAWFAAELALRRATGLDGTAEAALLMGCAVATIAACRLRLRLAPVSQRG
ncbi:MAG: hypothetical protein Kow0010_18170 [Dehalococcoidia bacterium]